MVRFTLYPHKSKESKDNILHDKTLYLFRHLDTNQRLTKVTFFRKYGIGDVTPTDNPTWLRP